MKLDKSILRNLYEADALDETTLREYATYLFNEADISDIDSIPSFEETNDWIVYVDKRNYNKIYKMVKKAIENVQDNMYNGYIELNDNHTYWNLNSISEDDNPDEAETAYEYLKDKAFEKFKEETGVELWQDGRSGRHIVVDFNFDNAYDYEHLKEVQERLEQWVIDEYNKKYPMNESIKVNKRRKQKEELEESLSPNSGRKKLPNGTYIMNYKGTYIVLNKHGLSIKEFNNEEDATEFAEKFDKKTKGEGIKESIQHTKRRTKSAEDYSDDELYDMLIKSKKFKKIVKDEFGYDVGPGEISTRAEEWLSGNFEGVCDVLGLKCDLEESALPDMCYSSLPSDDRKVIIIKRNEKGYYPVDVDFKDKETAQAYINKQNKSLGIDDKKKRAMEVGSMYGWNVPGAKLEESEKAPWSHTTVIYYGTTEDQGDDTNEVELVVDNRYDYPEITDKELDDTFENDNLDIWNNDLTGEEEMSDIKLFNDNGWLTYKGKGEDGKYHFIIEDYTKENLKESYDDEEPTENYTEVAHKSVQDKDGFMTDYTWYKDENGNSIFILGDRDIYNPDNTYSDWEEENEEAAKEWFDSYTGFEDLNEDINDDPDWHPESKRNEKEVEVVNKKPKTKRRYKKGDISSSDLNSGVNYEFKAGDDKYYMECFWSANEPFDTDEEKAEWENPDDVWGIAYNIYDENGEEIDGGMMLTYEDSFDSKQLCKDLAELSDYIEINNIRRIDEIPMLESADTIEKIDVSDKEPIGTFGIANAGGLLIYDIDENEDKVLAGIATDTKQPAEWYPIEWDEDGEPYFMWGEIKVPFNEILRINLF